MSIPFDIPNGSQSVKQDYEAGKITLREAAKIFYRYNYTNFIDENYAKKTLGIS